MRTTKKQSQWKSKNEIVKEANRARCKNIQNKKKTKVKKGERESVWDRGWERDRGIEGEIEKERVRERKKESEKEVES